MDYFFKIILLNKILEIIIKNMDYLHKIKQKKIDRLHNL